MFKDVILEFFRELNEQLFNSPATAPRFIPPSNEHTESVPAFRAHLHSLGLSEAEASDIIVARTVGGMVYLRSKGYTRDEIYDMPASRYLEKPTNPIEYGKYCALVRAHFAEMKLRRTCGLT